MIPLAGAVRQFGLHVDVAARWWLPYLPYAAEAQRFLYEHIPNGAIRLVAYAGIEAPVLDAIAQELGDDLDPFLAQTLAPDVQTLFAELAQRGILQAVSPQPYLRAALVATALHRIAFSDGLMVALAEAWRCPLLVADEERHQTLRRIEQVRPALHIAWLPAQFMP